MRSVGVDLPENVAVLGDLGSAKGAAVLATKLAVRKGEGVFAPESPGTAVLKRSAGTRYGPIASFSCGCTGLGTCSIKVTDTTLVCVNKGCFGKCSLEIEVPLQRVSPA